MENKTIIIILLVIIVVLGAGIGLKLLDPTNFKEPTNVRITSDKLQYENDGEISILLTDLNKTPLSKEIVNITITDNRGKVIVDDVVKTNSKGMAKLDLDLKKGTYAVNVAYGGNENYAGNGTTQKLTIKEEKVVKATVTNSNNNGGGQIDYNSPDSEYFKSETDGCYYKKEPGVDYVYAQDGRTGEWCYWLDKSK